MFMLVQFMFGSSHVHEHGHVHVRLGPRPGEAKGNVLKTSTQSLSSSMRPRRPRHIVPRGARSSGAAVLMAIITSEMANVEVRAVLGYCYSSDELQHTSATRWRA